jgi:hypothetical protein
MKSCKVENEHTGRNVKFHWTTMHSHTFSRGNPLYIPLDCPRDGLGVVAETDVMPITYLCTKLTAIMH